MLVLSKTFRPKTFSRGFSCTMFLERNYFLEHLCEISFLMKNYYFDSFVTYCLLSNVLNSSNDSTNTKHLFNGKIKVHLASKDSKSRNFAASFRPVVFTVLLVANSLETKFHGNLCIKWKHKGSRFQKIAVSITPVLSLKRNLTFRPVVVLAGCNIINLYFVSLISTSLLSFQPIPTHEFIPILLRTLMQLNVFL